MTELGVVLEPRHGLRYEQLLALARAAEESGLDAFHRSDHYLGVDPKDAGFRPTDAWITLAGLARETSRIRLGTLVTPATFRLPGPLAVAVGTVNEMSGGRVELGLGTGWSAEEHVQFGIPFPDTRERFDRLQEQLEILDGLWSTGLEQPFSFTGRYYRVDENVVFGGKSPRPPIIIGGTGPRRTPALAARFADEFNAGAAPLPDAVRLFALVRRLCEENGRDPASLKLSIMVPGVCVGVGRTEIERRRRTLAASIGEAPAEDMSGTPEEVAERLREWADAGADRIYILLLDVEDVEHVRLLGEAVKPLLVPTGR